MRILIAGGHGQLGAALVRRARGHDVIAFGREALDVTRLDTRDTIVAARPDLVINAAAYTNVDGCEDDPDRAYRVNALGARNVALGAERAGAALVQVSTDYVFDGRKGAPYWEYDPPSPISVYGASKLAGEQEATRVCRRSYVARTAWLFGLGSQNFVTRMLDLAQRLPRLEVVDNEVGCPTYCDDLASAILELAETEAFGTYHLVAEGHCSRHAFARRILDLSGFEGFPVDPVDHFPRRATAPTYAPLRNFAAAELGISLPAWEDGLERYLACLAKEPSG